MPRRVAVRRVPIEMLTASSMSIAHKLAAAKRVKPIKERTISPKGSRIIMHRPVPRQAVARRPKNELMEVTSPNARRAASRLPVNGTHRVAASAARLDTSPPIAVPA